MNKLNLLLATTIAAISIGVPFSVLSSEDDHDHGHEHEEKSEKKAVSAPDKAVKKDEHAHEDEHDHGDEKGDGEKGHEEKGHAHGEEEGEHGEEGGGSAVGPDKGITEANEEKGFKLSPEALKNFGVKTIPVQPGATLTLARKSIFFGLQERNLFRVRDGFFKRIDFKTVSKSSKEFTVTVTDVQAGDQIVTEGVGFLRIAELAATGGVGEGHSH